MTCTDLGASAGLAEILWCSFDLATGSRVLTALLIFTFLVYLFWKFRIPLFASVPLGILLVFVFAGAGNAALVAGGADIFTTLMWVFVMLLGPIIFFVFWRLRR